MYLPYLCFRFTADRWSQWKWFNTVRAPNLKQYTRTLKWVSGVILRLIAIHMRPWLRAVGILRKRAHS